MILEVTHQGIAPDQFISAITPYVIGGLSIVCVLIGLIWASNQSVIKELKSNQKEFQKSTQENREKMLVIVTALQKGQEQHGKDIEKINERLKG